MAARKTVKEEKPEGLVRRFYEEVTPAEYRSPEHYAAWRANASNVDIVYNFVQVPSDTVLEGTEYFELTAEDLAVLEYCHDELEIRRAIRDARVAANN